MTGHARLVGRVVAAATGLALLVPTAPASAAVTTLETALSGANEVPGPGDADGTGAAQVTVNVKKQKVCFTLVVLDITLPAAAAHIHEGAAGVAGDIVVTLEAPEEVAGSGIGLATGCVADVAKPLLRDIKNNPDQYYVNVHTSDFEAGAVRGQLAVA